MRGDWRRQDRDHKVKDVIVERKCRQGRLNSTASKLLGVCNLLMAAHEILEQHGGSSNAFVRGLGRFSCFRFPVSLMGLVAW